jgi:hypothetical protein
VVGSQGDQVLPFLFEADVDQVLVRELLCSPQFRVQLPQPGEPRLGDHSQGTSFRGSSSTSRSGCGPRVAGLPA